MTGLLALSVHVLGYLLLASGEGCIDGRGTSFAVSAVEVLKAFGPQGRAVSQSPILVTYGPARQTPKGCCCGFEHGGLGCNSPRDDRSQTPLDERIPLSSYSNHSVQLRFPIKAAKLVK